MRQMINCLFIHKTTINNKIFYNDLPRKKKNPKRINNELFPLTSIHYPVNR